MGMINGTAEDILLKTDVSQVLWQGTWSPGQSIVVPRSDKYTLFSIGMYGSGTRILAYRTSAGYIRGIGGFVSESGGIGLYAFTATFFDDAWKLIACKGGNPFTDSTLTDYQITDITGIM